MSGVYDTNGPKFYLETEVSTGVWVRSPDPVPKNYGLGYVDAWADALRLIAWYRIGARRRRVRLVREAYPGDAPAVVRVAGGDGTR